MYMFNNIGGIDEVGFCYNVGVEVIINDSGVFVGFGNFVDVEFLIIVDMLEFKISLYLCGFDEDWCCVLEEEGFIFGCLGVVYNCMDNIGIDVVLSSICCVIS